jgi:hypothetical protein
MTSEKVLSAEQIETLKKTKKKKLESNELVKK